MTFRDPYDTLSGNPYMAPMPAPDWKTVLGNALLGIGAGISNADAAGRGWGAGIAPGLAMGANMTGQQQQNAWQRQMQGMQYQSMQDHRRAQEAATREKLDMAKAAAARDAGMGNQLVEILGMRAPDSPVRMGPPTGDPASVIGGMESGNRYDAVGPETGKGRALGRYQVMSFNVGPWTKEVLGQEMTPEQFLANPQAQDAVFKAKFGQARQQYGSDEAASRWWFAGPGGMNNPNARDVLGTSVADYSRKFNAGMGGPMVAQGDAIAGQGDAPGQQSAIAALPAEVRAAIATVARQDPKAAATMLVNALQNQKKEDVWTPLSPESAKMFNLDPTKSWQMNKVTRKIEPVGGVSTEVKIDQRGEAEFGKEMGKMDAKRFGDIITAEGTMNDMASKLGFAMDQFRQTYTGPGAEAANQLNRILGAAGFTEAEKKANAADAAMAVVSQMKPHMRASGSGASSDKDMDMFARALPSLMNLPGGNERIVTFFQRMADRATQIRQLAQEHSEGGKVPLTRTGFDDAVKKLGPLFTEEERKELSGLTKVQPKSDRKSLNEILGGAEQNRTPMPNRQPLGSILGAP
jgi:hypothetical protein